MKQPFTMSILLECPEAVLEKKEPTASSGQTLGVQNFFDLSGKGGKLVLGNVPYNFRINSEILVNQNIAQARDLFPFYIGVFSADFIRDFLDRFPDDLKIADNCIQSFRITRKLGVSQAGGIGLNPRGRFQNVVEINPVITRH